MVTRSIVGRFLILAVLMVSLGVIAQAALIITRGTDKKSIKAASADAVQPATDDAAPVRVVYPGPLGDGSAQPHKIADAAPVSPLAAPGASAPTSAAASAPPATMPMAVAESQPAATQQSTLQLPAAQQPAITPPADSAPTVASSVVAAETAPAPAVAPAAAQPTSASSNSVVVASIDPAMGLPAAAPQPARPAETTTGSVATASTATASAKGININTAPAEALNHLQGAGRIGQSIVEHRPYRSVEDLLTKRVLRRSVYEQIKNRIAAR